MNNKELLAYIRALESNNGQNFNHPIIQHGLDKGNQAAGNYGLTSSTINDVVKNKPEYAALMGLNPSQKKEYIESHPQDENNIVNSLLDRLQNRYSGDPSKIAYAWNHGTYINPNKITPELMENDTYTNKFNRLSGISSPVKDNIAQQTFPSEPRGMKQSLDDLINDPSNPFNQKDEEDQDDDNDILKQYYQSKLV